MPTDDDDVVSLPFQELELRTIAAMLSGLSVTEETMPGGTQPRQPEQEGLDTTPRQSTEDRIRALFQTYGGNPTLTDRYPGYTTEEKEEGVPDNTRGATPGLRRIRIRRTL